MTTTIKAVEASFDTLSRYSEVPISFLVESVFRVEPEEKGLAGITLREEKIARPYVKDYDAARGEGPTRWLKRFDMSGWGILMAFIEDRHVGGAIVVLGGSIDNLDKRFAQLFDIRIHPDMRRRGTGASLLQHVADWARQYGCEQLKIETQNTNVPACRFYAGQDCELWHIERYAYIGYPESEHETRLVWYLKL
ncbi:MAG: GNAT family N-acetyltransferase [Dehalococcoidales bacterium]|nr:MAG: GNAT family N-acetyltransferase [Dehalococcoidales bacterium]